MPTSDRDLNRKDPLEDSINKLETFIDETEIHGDSGDIPVLTDSMEIQQPSLSMNVPILDEMVSDAGLKARESGDHEPSVSEDQLMGLIDKLEDRLTEVLKTLVKSMQDEMRDSISEEVKSQLDNYQDRLDSREE